MAVTSLLIIPSSPYENDSDATMTTLTHKLAIVTPLHSFDVTESQREELAGFLCGSVFMDAMTLHFRQHSYGEP